ncbi:MAG: hypothetical protein ACJZ4Z_03900 [Candidatus Thalassarchaeaceae archaeon]
MGLESRISNVLVGIILASIIFTPITGEFIQSESNNKILTVDSPIDCSEENNTSNDTMYVDNQLGDRLKPWNEKLSIWHC